MSFTRPVSFREDVRGLKTVSSTELDFIDLLLEKLIGGREGPRAYRCAVLDRFGVDLSTASFGDCLPLPIGVAPATYSHYPRQVEKLARIGFPFIGLKTVVAEDSTGNSSLEKYFRGNARNPDKVMLAYPVFLTGERGSALPLNKYIREVLRPCLEIASKRGIFVTPSIVGPSFGGKSVRSAENEWTHTTEVLLREINKADNGGDAPSCTSIGLDFPPYLSEEFDFAESTKVISDKYMSFVENVVRPFNIVSSAARCILPEREFHALPKINYEMIPVLKVILNGISRRGKPGFIGFGRAMGIHIDPFTLEPASSAFGGPEHLLRNIFTYKALGVDVDYEASYTGGVVTGGDAVAAFACGNISRVEMVSSFYFHGIRNSYKRVLGGLTAFMVHLHRTCPDKYGFNVDTVRDLNLKAFQPSVDAAFGKRLRVSKKAFVAVVDRKKCRDCRQTTAGLKRGVCMALDLCPGFAFKRKISRGKGYYVVNSDKCLGCGTCVPVSSSCGAVRLIARI